MNYSLILCLVLLAFCDSFGALRRIKRGSMNSTIDQDFAIVTEDCNVTTTTETLTGQVAINMTEPKQDMTGFTPTPITDKAHPISPSTPAQSPDLVVQYSGSLSPIVTPNPSDTLVDNASAQAHAPTAAAFTATTPAFIKEKPSRPSVNDKHSKHFKCGAGRRCENAKLEHERAKISNEEKQNDSKPMKAGEGDVPLQTMKVRVRLINPLPKNNVKSKVAFEGDDGNNTKNHNNNKINTNKENTENIMNMSNFSNGNGNANANANIKTANNNNDKDINNNNANNQNKDAIEAFIRHRHNKAQAKDNWKLYFTGGVLTLPLTTTVKSMYEQELERQSELERQQEYLQEQQQRLWQRYVEQQQQQQEDIEMQLNNLLGKYTPADNAMQFANMLMHKHDDKPKRAQGKTQVFNNPNPFKNNQPHNDSDDDFDAIVDQGPGVGGQSGTDRVPPSLRDMRFDSGQPFNNIPMSRPYRVFQSSGPDTTGSQQEKQKHLKLIENGVDLMLEEGLVSMDGTLKESFEFDVQRHHENQNKDVHCSFVGGDNDKRVVCSCRMLKKKHWPQSF